MKAVFLQMFGLMAFIKQKENDYNDEGVCFYFIMEWVMHGSLQYLMSVYADG